MLENEIRRMLQNQQLDIKNYDSISTMLNLRSRSTNQS